MINSSTSWTHYLFHSNVEIVQFNFVVIYVSLLRLLRTEFLVHLGGMGPNAVAPLQKWTFNCIAWSRKVLTMSRTNWYISVCWSARYQAIRFRCLCEVKRKDRIRKHVFFYLNVYFWEKDYKDINSKLSENFNVWMCSSYFVNFKTITIICWFRSRDGKILRNGNGKTLSLKN